MIAGSNKSDRPINITVIGKVHLRTDCVQGYIVNGVREPILYSFALSSRPGHKILTEPGIKLFKKITKTVLSDITIYLEDNDHKPVDFNTDSILLTCQLIKTQ